MPFEGVRNAAPPPKVTAPRPAAAPKKSSGKQALREEAANGIGQIVAFGAMVSGQLADAGAIGMHWPGMAHEAAVTAETDAKMAALLDKLLEVGPYGNLIIATLPLVAQLLVNHSLVKLEAMAGAGVVHPDALTAQVRAEMARKAMDAMRDQQRAESELKQMAAQMAAAQNGTEPAE
jgi:hypothetical protein